MGTYMPHPPPGPHQSPGTPPGPWDPPSPPPKQPQPVSPPRREWPFSAPENLRESGMFPGMIAWHPESVCNGRPLWHQMPSQR